MQLQGKLTVLTGASRGIGNALAHALADAGSDLVLTALEADELERVRSELPGRVDALAADLTDARARKEFVRFVRERDPAPDILINNSGIGYFGRFDSVSWEGIDRTIELNVRATTYLTHELLPLLKSRPEARIVNLSSASARFPYPCLSVYGATKAFISAFSETLACELSGSNVGVLCVHPGFTATAFMQSAGMDMSKVPDFLVHKPEQVARRIVRAIERDQRWVYGDALSRALTDIADLLPVPTRRPLFKNLFWRLPDAA